MITGLIRYPFKSTRAVGEKYGKNFRSQSAILIITHMHNVIYQRITERLVV
jgi:hypothetical protein